jgi:hypothetical protein
MPQRNLRDVLAFRLLTQTSLLPLAPGGAGEPPGEESSDSPGDPGAGGFDGNSVATRLSLSTLRLFGLPTAAETE